MNYGYGYNNNYNHSSLYGGNYGRTDKEMLKECLKSSIMPKDENTKYYLVSVKWLARWKEYVNFNVDGADPRPKDEIQQLHPGEIDNSDLMDTVEENELKKGLLEKKDYEILTETAWLKIHTIYRVSLVIYCLVLVIFPLQGGPQIQKGVVNIGTKDVPMYQIEIYMLPFRIHIAQTKGFELPDLMQGIKWNVSKNCVFGLVCSDVLKRRKQIHHNNYRCWVRRHPPPKVENGETADSAAQPDAPTPTATEETDYVTVEKADVEAEQGMSNQVDSQETVVEGSNGGDDDRVPPEGKLPTFRRQLTADIVEVDGDWRLIRRPDKASVVDFCVDDGGVTEIIIEVGPSVYSSNFYSTYNNNFAPSEADWPLAEKALAWQKDLRVGDEVDCLDKKNHWLEAVVIGFDEDKGVRVHFKGWEALHDEVIPADKVAVRMLPLYSNSKNWRANIEEDDKVDIRIEVDGKHKWVLGTVQEINVPEKKVLVKYSDSDITAAANPNGKRSLEDIDDDNDKPLTLMEVEHKQEKANETAATVPPPPTDHLVWRSIEGEDICSAETHTPVQVRRSAYGGGYRSYDDLYGEKNTTGKPLAKGVVGLQNIGNTCFMNSILQCMSNTYCLTNFFVTNQYKSQINATNVLGHKGEVAMSYAKLMKDMWCDGYTKVVPRNFKKVIGEFQPQFAGFSQQDSQEFLGFLLDGLHEDLNRIVKSPYVPKIDSNGRDDILIARESWRRFLLRNDSALVDRVYGQLRSHVTCCNCGRESVTFDAFNTLSLPVPINTAKTITVTVRQLPVGTPPLKVKVAVELTDLIGDLRLKTIRQLQKAGRLQGYDCSKVKSITSYALSAEDHREPNVITMPGDHWASIADVNVADDMDIDDANKVSSDDAAKNGAAGTQKPLTAAQSIELEKAQYAQRAADIADGNTSLEPIFHVGMVYEHDMNKVSKSLDDRSPVGDLLRGREHAMLFQLEHPCTIKSRDNKKFVYFVDLQFWVKKVNTTHYSTYDQFDTFCCPERINVTRDTTPADLYVVADRAFRRIMNSSSEHFDNPAKRPYLLHVKRVHDFRPTRTLDPSDTVPIVFSEFECLTMQLLDDVNNRAHISPEEIKRYDVIEGDEEGSDTEDVVNPYMGGRRKSKSGLTVYKCLDKFVEREQLNQAETIYCSRCKQHLAPVKKMDLWATPDVLVIHLKRFQYMPGQYFVHREKISDFIDFPVEGLDLTNYVMGPQQQDALPIYDLFGVSHHSGGLGGGHYTAICKNPLNNNWYSFNDSFVQQSSAAAAVNEQAYVLFYKRRQGELKWAGIEPLEEPLPDE